MRKGIYRLWTREENESCQQAFRAGGEIWFEWARRYQQHPFDLLREI